MAICNAITQNLISACAALEAAGGVQDFAYVLENRADLTYTTNANGGIATMTLATGVSLAKITGKRLSNSANSTLTNSDDRRKFFNHEVKFGVYANNSAGIHALQDLIKTQKAVIFLPLNDNTIRVYGLDFGMQTTAFESPTGTKIEDGISKMITWSDIQLNLPVYCEIGASYALTKTALDNLTFGNSYTG